MRIMQWKTVLERAAAAAAAVQLASSCLQPTPSYIHVITAEDRCHAENTLCFAIDVNILAAIW